MKQLDYYIQEKLKINETSFMLEKLKITSNTKVNAKQSFTDEELMDDYNRVDGSYTKAEKQKFANKYDVNSNKFKEIQAVILDKLRENRHNKKDFNENDVIYFYRMNIPDTPYRKAKEFFDKEPIEFIEYLKSYFENESEYFKKARAAFRRFGSFSRISGADRHQLNMYNNVIKYLEEYK